MSLISIIGLIAIAVTLVVGLTVKIITGRKIKDLEGFQGVVDLDKLEEDEDEAEESE